MALATGIIVERGQYLPHPYGVLICDGVCKDITFALAKTPKQNIGEEVEVEFCPDDQFAKIL